MKDRAERLREIWIQYEKNSKSFVDDFYERRGFKFEGKHYYYSTDDEDGGGEKDLEDLLEARGYNEIFKQHIMAYRIVNRLRSALVDLTTPLGKKKAERFADEYEAGVKK